MRTKWLIAAAVLLSLALLLTTPHPLRRMASPFGDFVGGMKEGEAYHKGYEEGFRDGASPGGFKEGGGGGGGGRSGAGGGGGRGRFRDCACL